MFKVNSCEFNYQYGDQIHFPCRIASMVTYVKTNEKIKNNFKFEKSFVFRTEVEEYIKECHDTNILLCSCYVWNWEITKHLASEVKKILITIHPKVMLFIYWKNFVGLCQL